MQQPGTDRASTSSVRLVDDGLVPNHPRWPLVIHQGAFATGGPRDLAHEMETHFAANGWGQSWRNGIYPFHHFHSGIHEVLGVAAGRARVRFGGEQGQDVELEAGDVAVLPAGTGHRCLEASPDLLVVGAYPPDGQYDLCRATPEDHAVATLTVPQVPRPATDPVFGTVGGILTLWT